MSGRTGGAKALKTRLRRKRIGQYASCRKEGYVYGYQQCE